MGALDDRKLREGLSSSEKGVEFVEADLSRRRFFEFLEADLSRRRFFDLLECHIKVSFVCFELAGQVPRVCPWLNEGSI